MNPHLKLALVLYGIGAFAATVLVIFAINKKSEGMEQINPTRFWLTVLFWPLLLWFLLAAFVANVVTLRKER